jgi:hypothetical protein
MSTKKPFAQGTKVDMTRSHVELRQLLMKYGASQAGSFGDESTESLMFAKDGLTYRFTLTLPTTEAECRGFQGYSFNRHGTKLDAERNRRMRAFVSVIKAKLIAIDEGIATFESEFIGNAVTDNGQTVAERWAPQIKAAALEGKVPSALPFFGGDR